MTKLARLLVKMPNDFLILRTSVKNAAEKERYKKTKALNCQ